MQHRNRDETWTLERLRDAVVPPSGLRVCSGPALHGLLGAAVDSVGPGPFGMAAGSPTFLRGLEALLDELVLGSVSAETLVEAACRMGSAGGRLAHLGRLVEACTAAMSAAHIELASARWVTASAALSRGWPPGLVAERLELTLAPPFPPAVVAFVASLARAASDSSRTLVLNVPLTGDAALDAALEPLLQALEAGPDLPGVELLPGIFEGPLSEPVRRLGIAPAGSAPTDRLEAVVAPGPGREAAAMVSALRREVEAGASLRDCALAVLAPEDAGELVRALEDAGLPSGRRPPVPLAATAAGKVGLVWASLASRHARVEDVAWLLGQRLVPALRLDGRLDPLPLLRRAGVRDAVLGAEGAMSAYRVRLAAFSARRRAVQDDRSARAADQLLDASERLLALADRLPRRARLADLLEAWRAGLETGGFWTALEHEALATDGEARRSSAREAAAIEVWRAFVRDTRAGWKAARTQGPEMDRAAFARWLADAAADLPVDSGPGAPGGVDVLPLEALEERRLAFLGVAGLDATSFPRRAEPALL